ncbi:MAG TPA: hypothetical protein VGN17_25840 [Bryobacteraceae bacterium]|jgi:hypothetical protein
MKFAVLAALLAALCFAEEPQKPACDASHRGQLWPQEANLDSQAARESFQTGELEICAANNRKFRWEHLSVNVHDLAKPKHPPASDAKKPDSRESK